MKYSLILLLLLTNCSTQGRVYYEEQNQKILDGNYCEYASYNYGNGPSQDFKDCIQKQRYYRENPAAAPIYPPIPNKTHCKTRAVGDEIHTDCN